MDRRSIIKNAGIAGVLAAGAAPAVHAQATLRWRCASSFPKALDTLFGVCDVFAKKVGELSGGKFTISTHAAGELMPAFGVLDGVFDGVALLESGALTLERVVVSHVTRHMTLHPNRLRHSK
jgi:TRAP-type mannitol/chloroaromatic compound transport system substrate-binding protein